MMKLNHTAMTEELGRMMAANEEPICPVYCVFQPTGFLEALGSRTSTFGYATITSGARMMFIQKNVIGGRGFISVMLPSLKKIKINNNILGQTSIDFTFPDKGKDFRIRIQVASKVIGCDFPEQGDNLKRMLYVLEQFDKKLNGTK